MIASESWNIYIYTVNEKGGTYTFINVYPTSYAANAMQLSIYTAHHLKVCSKVKMQIHLTFHESATESAVHGLRLPGSRTAVLKLSF